MKVPIMYFMAFPNNSDTEIRDFMLYFEQTSVSAVTASVLLDFMRDTVTMTNSFP